ncbi:hypothetical protein GobsT_00820 [Gemmata obscuriglobus]|uniref:hypothetical protein n=1 Tax=Gemmata obscuriglobus TaxID=114 RepID=UPI0011CD0BB5
MSTSPDVAPFATILADLASDLRRGTCCLVVGDKGWTLPLYVGLKQRLQAVNTRIGYLDGRVKDKEAAGAESGVMLAAVAQMRWAARAPEAENVVFALPHLDIMTAVEGGWTSISREVIPLLYENINSVWLGFQDPSVTLPALVEKVFTRRYFIEVPFRTLETAGTVTTKEPDPAAPADAAFQSIHHPEGPTIRSEPDAHRDPNAVTYSWEPRTGALRDDTPVNPTEPPDSSTSSTAQD